MRLFSCRQGHERQQCALLTAEGLALIAYPHCLQEAVSEALLVGRRKPGRPSSVSGEAVSDFSCSGAARVPTAAPNSVSAALGRSSPLTSGLEGNWARPSWRRSLCSEIVSSSSRA